MTKYPDRIPWLPDTINGLQDGQKLIQTDAMVELFGLMEAMTSSSRRYRCIALVSGSIGSGLSTALKVYLSFFQGLKHTGVPDHILVDVPTYASQKDLVISIADMMKESISEESHWKTPNYLKQILCNHQVIQIVFDCGENFSVKNLAFVCQLHKITHIPMVIAGRKHLKDVARRVEDISSYVGYNVDFLTLDEKDFIKEFLPKVSFSRWQYDPKKQADLEMGKKVWKVTHPDLRKLFNFLETANQTAEKDGEEPITMETIDETILLTQIKKSHHEFDEEDEAGDADPKDDGDLKTT